MASPDTAGRLGDRARSAGSVTAKVARTATVTVARTATATAKAATTKAASARAAAVARKASAPTAATVTTTPAKPATAKATATKPTAATTTAAKASTPKSVTAKVSTAKASTAEAAVEASAPAAPATTPARVRPTPYKRTPEVSPLPVLDGPAVDDVALPAAVQVASRRPAVLRRLPVLRRRPALALAAVAVCAMSVTAASAGEPADTRTISATVSVAETLGITAEQSAPIVDAETTDRLGDLVASRAERDAQQEQAADVQEDADRKAAEQARLAAIAAAEAARPKAVAPVKGARLTSGFGARWGTLHAGVDLAAPMRTPEYAAMDGVVLEAGPASGFGLAVYIQHENGDVTVYGHMDEILVTAGQVVKAGDTIALLGNRGQSTGPHLHFEVHQGGLDGTKIDPIPWLRERGVTI